MSATDDRTEGDRKVAVCSTCGKDPDICRHMQPWSMDELAAAHQALNESGLLDDLCGAVAPMPHAPRETCRLLKGHPDNHESARYSWRPAPERPEGDRG